MATEQPGTVGGRQGLLLAELSNAMVRLYKERFGRGPTKVRTSYAGPDLLVSVLEDTLTAPERRLAELGEHARIRDTRALLRRAAERDFAEAVQRITGRSVRSYVSAVESEHDTACETFVLEPERPGQDSNLRPAA